MQTRSYDSLFNLVKALAGVNDFTTEEDSYILNFTNRRFKQAFDAYPFWARYLVAGEARTSDANNLIAFTEAGKTNIGEFLRIHRSQPFNRNSTIEYDFYVTGEGASLLNIQSNSSGSVFVTYKKEVPDIVSSSLIPLEFFYFMAHAVYADFLRMDGQNQKAIAEEQIAEQYLDDELGKASIIANTNIVGKKISTYVNRQSR